MTAVATMSFTQENLINVGNYVVIQRWNFMKVIHFGGIKGDDYDVVLGNDIVNISSAVDKPYWSTFKLIPEPVGKKSKKRYYKTEICDKSENPGLSAEIIKDMSSGSDNRDIKDDGKSQNLSTQNIHQLRDTGTSAQDIVEQLIENSTTFQKKTEFAQEKYLSKKKRKYFDYVLLRPTSLRLIIEINNKKDPSKFLGITMDTLSHMVTACNIQPKGNYLTYENGGSGIISAMILNYLDTFGKVIQIHPGAFPQKSCVLSLNLSKEKLDSYLPISVRDIKEVCKCVNQQSATVKKISLKEENGTLNDNNKESLNEKSSQKATVQNDEVSESLNLTQSSAFIFDQEEIKANISLNSNKVQNIPDSSDKHVRDNHNKDIVEIQDNAISNTTDTSPKENLKRKNSDIHLNSNKKSCYDYDAIRMTQIENILLNKVDGLILVCKEHPLSVLREFIQYVAPSRPIIVYSLYREPLVELFMEMKNSKLPVINVRLTESFLRSYQVLPERTHPHMSMTSTGGFLLTATVIEK